MQLVITPLSGDQQKHKFVHKVMGVVPMEFEGKNAKEWAPQGAYHYRLHELVTHVNGEPRQDALDRLKTHLEQVLGGIATVAIEASGVAAE